MRKKRTNRKFDDLTATLVISSPFHHRYAAKYLSRQNGLRRIGRRVVSGHRHLPVHRLPGCSDVDCVSDLAETAGSTRAATAAAAAAARVSDILHFLPPVLC